VALVVGGTNLVLGLLGGNELGVLFGGLVAGAAIGFLLFNWNPAVMFMGDVGSTFLGFMLATGSVLANQKTSSAVAMLVPIVALGVPVTDTLLSMVRRFLERRPLFSPDKGHLHHRLLRLGLTHRRAVWLIYGLSVLFAGAALALTAARDLRAGVVLGLVVVLVFVLARVAGLMRQPKVLGRLRRRGRVARALREGLPRFEQRLDADGLDMDGAWQALVDLCREAGCSHVAWRTRGQTRPDRRSQPLAAGADGGPVEPVFHTTATAALNSAAYIELAFVIPEHKQKLDHELVPLLNRLAIDIVRFRPAPGQGGTDLDDQAWLTAQRRARGELPRDPDQIDQADQADQPDQAHQSHRTDHPTPDPEKAPDNRRQDG
jgi:hypothetical protein